MEDSIAPCDHHHCPNEVGNQFAANRVCPEFFEASHVVSSYSICRTIITSGELFQRYTVASSAAGVERLRHLMSFVAVPVIVTPTASHSCYLITDIATLVSIEVRPEVPLVCTVLIAERHHTDTRNEEGGQHERHLPTPVLVGAILWRHRQQQASSGTN